MFQKQTQLVYHAHTCTHNSNQVKEPTIIEGARSKEAKHNFITFAWVIIMANAHAHMYVCMYMYVHVVVHTVVYLPVVVVVVFVAYAVVVVYVVVFVVVVVVMAPYLDSIQYK